MIRIRKHTREDIFYKLKWLSDPYVRYLIGEKPNKKANLKDEVYFNGRYYNLITMAKFNK